MKKIRKAIIPLFAAACMLLFSGCSAGDESSPLDEIIPYGQEQPISIEPVSVVPEEPPEIEVTAGVYADNISYSENFVSTVPLELATELFYRMHEIWDEDDGELWGFHLFTPSMIADPISRHVVANMPDPKGHFTRLGDVYVGILPDDVLVSHTIADFAGLTWGMLMWGPSESSLYESGEFELFFEDGRDGFVTSLLVVLVHEAFHVVQLQILPEHDTISPLANQNSPHAQACADARVSILLEMNALRQALSTEGEERHRAIHDAISIRAHRRYGRPEVYLSENLQELNEGIVTFTHTHLVHGSAEYLLADYSEYWIEAMMESSGMGAMFPYFTGAAYSFLLHDTGVTWRYGLTWDTDLAALLKEAVGIEEFLCFNEIDLERYGYSQLAPVARAFTEHLQRVTEGAWEFAGLSDNITIEGLWTFGGIFANEIIILDTEDGSGRYLVSYGHIDFISSNWRIEVLSGYVILNSRTMEITLPFYENIAICEDGIRAVTPNWELEIIDDAYILRLDERGSVEIVERMV